MIDSWLEDTASQMPVGEESDVECSEVELVGGGVLLLTGLSSSMYAWCTWGAHAFGP